ncbi:DUF4907 domain-containing protein [Arachidicoccus ginsenosidivorans]|nr:DUF4907 domain-containing protein [Arachidicoccus ginsenosidivorans]
MRAIICSVRQFVTRRFDLSLMVWLFFVATLPLLNSCQNSDHSQNKNRTERLTKAGALGQKAAIPAVTPAGVQAGAPIFNEDSSLLRVQAVKLTASAADARWGYEIYVKDSLLIRQLSVPAVAGKYGFTSKADAEKIGEMVIRKLKTHQIPSISLEELTKAGVRYKAF